MGFCSKGLKNEFETAVVNEPSVFEPLKFYCISSFFSNVYATFRNFKASSPRNGAVKIYSQSACGWLRSGDGAGELSVPGRPTDWDRD